jgi:signal transduction histidine kinase
MRRFAHGLPGVMDWVDINVVVETALHIVDTGDKEDLHFIRSLVPTHQMPEVLCQRHQIAQVLLNLLQNAIQATEGTGTIEVKTRSVESWIEVEVSDDGPGLASDRRERVFDAFYTTKDEGTGLGLAISRDIVQAHKGTLQAIEAPIGARFLLRLPLEAP